MSASDIRVHGKKDSRISLRSSGLRLLTIRLWVPANSTNLILRSPRSGRLEGWPQERAYRLSVCMQVGYAAISEIYLLQLNRIFGGAVLVGFSSQGVPSNAQWNKARPDRPRRHSGHR